MDEGFRKLITDSYAQIGRSAALDSSSLKAIEDHYQGDYKSYINDFYDQTGGDKSALTEGVWRHMETSYGLGPAVAVSPSEVPLKQSESTPSSDFVTNITSGVLGVKDTGAPKYIAPKENIESLSMTVLSPKKEEEFQSWWNNNPDVVAWKKDFKTRYNETPSMDGYDYRGAFEAGITPQPNPDHDNAYHWESIGMDGKDLKPIHHPTRWKSEYMKETGVNPDKTGVTYDEAVKERPGLSKYSPDASLEPSTSPSKEEMDWYNDVIDGVNTSDPDAYRHSPKFQAIQNKVIAERTSIDPYKEISSANAGIAATNAFIKENRQKAKEADYFLLKGKTGEDLGYTTADARNMPERETEDKKNLDLATELMSKSNSAVLDVEAAQGRGGLANIAVGTGIGAYNYVKDYATLIGQLKDNSQITAVEKKMQRIENGSDESFTLGESALIQALMTSDKVTKSLDKVLPESYRLGTSLGTSAGFMAEYILTGGPASIVRDVLLKVAGRAGVAGAGAKALLNVGLKLAETGVHVAVQPTLYKEIARNVSTGQSIGRAIGNAAYDTAVNTGTEKIFENMAMKYAANATGVQRMLARSGNAIAGQHGLSGLLKSTGEEYAEEVVGNALQGLKDVYQQKRTGEQAWKDFTDITNNLRTLASVAVMTGAMGGVQEADRAYQGHLLQVDLKSIGQTVDKGVRSIIDDAVKNKNLSSSQVMAVATQTALRHAATVDNADERKQGLTDAVKYAYAGIRVNAFEEGARSSKGIVFDAATIGDKTYSLAVGETSLTINEPFATQEEAEDVAKKLLDKSKTPNSFISKVTEKDGGFEVSIVPAIKEVDAKKAVLAFSNEVSDLIPEEKAVPVETPNTIPDEIQGQGGQEVPAQEGQQEKVVIPNTAEDGKEDEGQGKKLLVPEQAAAAEVAAPVSDTVPGRQRVREQVSSSSQGKVTEREIDDQMTVLDAMFQTMRPDMSLDQAYDHYIGEVTSSPDKFNAAGGQVTQGDQGAIMWENGKAVIGLFSKADPSTLLHEAGGHIGRVILEEKSKSDSQFKTDYNDAALWSGAVANADGTHTWTVEAEEKFARSFEKYVQDGELPENAPSGLKKAFDALSKMLRDIYEYLLDTNYDLSPEIKRVFGNMIVDTSAQEKVAETGAKTKKNGVLKQESNDTKEERRLRRSGRQAAADGQPSIGKGETSTQGTRLVESTQVGDQVYFEGVRHDVEAQTENTVTINGEELNKSKVSTETPLVKEAGKAFDVDKLAGAVRINDINDDDLNDEVFDRARMQNLEISDDETLGLSAFVKQELLNAANKEQSIGQVIDGSVAKFKAASEVSVSPAANLVNPSAKGSAITTPNGSYNDAVRNNQSDTGANLWIRNDKSADNGGRVLMVQFSSHFLYGKQPFKRSANSGYFDALYRLVKGYDRTVDFWEVPLWMARTAGMEANSDVYVIRDIEEAKKFIGESGYDRVLFSALDVNEKHIVDVLDAVPQQQFSIGGYTKFDNIKAHANAKVFASMEDYAKEYGLKDNQEYSYRHFKGTAVIPRLKMSEGCKYACAFCSIPKTVINQPRDVIDRQVSSIQDLDASLVYLDDKTFGQATNYTSLPDAYKKIKEYNPDFQGFVVQTTAVDFANTRKFSPEYLKASGIKYVELGVETYNDPLLTALNKRHSHKRFTDAAVQNARENGVKVIPNVIVGLVATEKVNGKSRVVMQETNATYLNTLHFLEANADVISHLNVYSLALYEGTELGDAVEVKSEADTNENIVTKSFHENKEIHEWAMDEFSKFGINQIEKNAHPQGVLKQSSGETFFSTVEKSLGSISQNKGTTDQFKAMLLKNGAKQAEMDWMGYDQEFPGNKPVTKADIQNWIDQNKIEVKEVEKSTMNKISPDNWVESDNNYGYSNYINEGWKIEQVGRDKLYIYRPNGEKMPSYWSDLTGAKHRVVQYMSENGDVRYSQYVEPGGENYKELLLTMPPSQEANMFTGEKFVSNHSDANFHSSHFDEPNILAHIRFDERRVAGDSYSSSYGKKVLFIEEIQSDWAQKGKKQGFNGGFTINNTEIKREDAFDSYDLYVKDTGRRVGRIYGMDLPKNVTADEIHQIAIREAVKKPMITGVPNMPFQKTDQWVNLSLRRMMKYAVDNGFDRIAWTNGEMQAQRYDLSKQIDSLIYKINPDKTYDVSTLKDGGQLSLHHDLSDSDLESYFGKELAAKMINHEGSVPQDGYRELSGLDLKVGGEGMKAFYDQIIPSAANKLGKPFGAKVENVEIKNIDINTFQEKPTNTVQSLPITPAMAAAVRSGVPLFQRSTAIENNDVAITRTTIENKKSIKTQDLATAEEKTSMSAIIMHIGDKLSKATKKEDRLNDAILYSEGFADVKSFDDFQKKIIADLGKTNKSATFKDVVVAVIKEELNAKNASGKPVIDMDDITKRRLNGLLADVKKANTVRSTLKSVTAVLDAVQELKDARQMRGLRAAVAKIKKGLHANKNKYSVLHNTVKRFAEIDPQTVINSGDPALIHKYFTHLSSLGQKEADIEGTPKDFSDFVSELESLLNTEDIEAAAERINASDKSRLEKVKELADMFNLSEDLAKKYIEKAAAIPTYRSEKVSDLLNTTAEDLAKKFDFTTEENGEDVPDVERAQEIIDAVHAAIAHIQEIQKQIKRDTLFGTQVANISLDGIRDLTLSQLERLEKQFDKMSRGIATNGLYEYVHDQLAREAGEHVSKMFLDALVDNIVKQAEKIRAMIHPMDLDSIRRRHLETWGRAVSLMGKKKNTNWKAPADVFDAHSWYKLETAIGKSYKHAQLLHEKFDAALTKLYHSLKDEARKDVNYWYTFLRKQVELDGLGEQGIEDYYTASRVEYDKTGDDLSVERVKRLDRVWAALDKYKTTDTEGRVHLDTDAMLADMSPELKAVHEAIEEGMLEMDPMSVFIQTIVRGGNLDKIPGYFPQRATVTTESKDLEDFMNNMFGKGTRASSTYQRSKNRAIDFNAFSIYQRHINDVMRDYYLTPAVKDMRAFFDALRAAIPEQSENDAEQQLNAEARRIIKEIDDVFMNKHTKDEAKRSVITHYLMGFNSRATTFPGKLIHGLLTRYAQTLISHPVKTIGETISNVPMGLSFAEEMKRGKRVAAQKIPAGLTSDEIEVLKARRSGKPIAEHFGSDAAEILSRYSDDILRSQKNYAATFNDTYTGYDSVLAFLEHNKLSDQWVKPLNNWLISTGDRVFVHPAWNGALEIKFKELTGEWIDRRAFDEDSDYRIKYDSQLRKSVQAADEVRARLSNPTSKVGADIRDATGQITGPDHWYIRMIDRLFYGFGSREGNTLRANLDVIMSSKPTAEQKAKAWYQMGMLYMRNLVYQEVMAAAYIAFFGMGPDKDKFWKKFGSLEYHLRQMVNPALTLGLGSMGNLIKIPIAWGVEGVNKWLTETYGHVYDPMNDSFLMAPKFLKTAGDVVSVLLPGAGKAVGQQYQNIMDDKDFTGKDAMNIMAISVAMSGTVPGLKSIVSSANALYRENNPSPEQYARDGKSMKSMLDKMRSGGEPSFPQRAALAVERYVIYSKISDQETRDYIRYFNDNRNSMEHKIAMLSNIRNRPEDWAAFKKAARINLSSEDGKRVEPYVVVVNLSKDRGAEPKEKEIKVVSEDLLTAYVNSTKTK